VVTNPYETDQDDTSPPPVTLDSVPPDRGPIRPKFSPVGTGLAAVVLLACLSLYGWLQVSVPPLERVSTPERALPLLVGRTLDLEDALMRLPVWERGFYRLTMDGGPDELTQAITWYEELVAARPHPVSQLQLAILQAEAGRLDEVRHTTEAWTARQDPYPTFTRFLRAAYLEPKPDPVSEPLLQAELAETLPAGWFHDRLALRLAMRSGDHPRQSAIRDALTRRGDSLVKRMRGIAVLDWGAFLLGFVVWRRRWSRRSGAPASLRVGAAPLPPCWRGRDGVAVLVRGGALGGALTLGFLLWADLPPPVLATLSIPLANLPVLLLAHRYLLGGEAQGFRSGLGLWPLAGTWGRLGMAVTVAVAAGLVGEWGVGLAADQFGLSDHWTEWFDSELVWGSRTIVVLTMLQYVVLAPMFEELVFRGLLFGTLRRKFRWETAAVISAAIFALAHGYGVLGFTGVLWSGVVWAWAYEKTGSLLPGLLAHALNNLMVCLSVLVLLRN